ncbi:hypothetical protein [Pseudoalteromonas sp. MMG024]|uniref:hypothetical protein n=1 Tax=Pseudoalteromonas sp. MMG024 TaxID=2909980 RepID=UPI001F43CF4C|nr:hypothetical protein [Pseudoalteromonas sp. MMG024]MCF6458557.1 hypothetical protein [Pseudoalteromonas sp. MMG024]
MKKVVIFTLAVVGILIAMWPAGFAVGYQVKERELCQKVKGNKVLFKFTAGGIMRGETAEGTLRSSLYVDGLKKGMLFSLKQCFDNTQN